MEIFASKLIAEWILLEGGGGVGMEDLTPSERVVICVVLDPDRSTYRLTPQ